jgi:hypothetical protein
MRTRTVVAATAAVALLAALAYVVMRTAAGHEDWVELAAIATATLLAGGALFTRPAPRRSANPVLRRTPESDW